MHLHNASASAALDVLQRCVHLMGQQHITLAPFLCFLHCVQHSWCIECSWRTQHCLYNIAKQHKQVNIDTAIITPVRETVIAPAIMIPSVGFCTAALLTESTVLDVTKVACVAWGGILELKRNIVVTVWGEHWCQGGRPASWQSFIRIAKGSPSKQVEHGAHRVAL